MRKLLFDTEREEARVAAHEHMRHQRILMGMHPDHHHHPHPGTAPGGAIVVNPSVVVPAGMVPVNPAMYAQMAKPPNPSAAGAAATASAAVHPGGGMTPETYQQMYAAAFQAGGMIPLVAPVGSPVQASGSLFGGPTMAAAGADSLPPPPPLEAAVGDEAPKGPSPEDENDVDAPIPPVVDEGSDEVGDSVVDV
jgi:hypothetical protein